MCGHARTHRPSLGQAEGPWEPTLGWRLCLLALAILVSGCRWTSTGRNVHGVGLFQQGRFAEALQQFQAALSSDPSNPDAYYNLASTYHRVAVANPNKDLRLVEQAESLYNQCLDLSPNHVECHRGLAVLLAESGRPDSAVLLLTNWKDSNPQLSAPRVELARLNQEFGKTQLAERYLDEALAINPSDYRAWAAKGQMREETGELYQALQNYQHSLALNRLQPNLYQRVGTVNARIAQNTQAGQSSGWTAQPNLPGTLRRY